MPDFAVAGVDVPAEGLGFAGVAAAADFDPFAVAEEVPFPGAVCVEAVVVAP